MTLVVDRPRDQCGSAVFVRSGIDVDKSSSELSNIEVLNMQLMGIYVSAVYKPSNEEFFFPADFTDDPVNMVIGDFKIHIVLWGYSETNDNWKS